MPTVMVTVVGNPTIDIIYTHDGVFKRFGGPIYYASLALNALGAKARVVGVASPEVAHELREVFQRLGVEPQFVEADVTTTFELDYRKKPRSVRLLKRPSLGVKKASGDVVILSPVYDELRETVVDAGKVAADLQGYLRANLPPPEADLVHFSLDDLSLGLKELSEFASRWPTVVYTLGEEGAYVVQHGDVYYVNSARIKVEDVTGSGDVFLTALTYLHFVKREELFKAICESSQYVAGFLATGVVSRYQFDCAIQVVLRR